MLHRCCLSLTLAAVTALGSQPAQAASRPETTPQPAASPQPSATPSSVVGAGAWLTPTLGTWTVDYSTWWGDWGVGAGFVSFGQGGPPLLAPSLELMGRRRWFGPVEALFGYRNAGGRHFGAGGLGLDWPLPMNDRWRVAGMGQLGTGLAAGEYFFDARLGMTVHLNDGMRFVIETMPGQHHAVIPVLEKRLALAGLDRFHVRTLGDRRIVVDAYGVTDPAALRERLLRPGLLTFRARRKDIPNGYPAGPELGPDAWAFTDLTGRMIAEVELRETPFGPAVWMRFNRDGTRRLAGISRLLLDKPVGLFLDETLLIEPNIRSEIDTGELTVNGEFSRAEAEDLVATLKAGPLPAPVRLLEEDRLPGVFSFGYRQMGWLAGATPYGVGGPYAGIELGF